eukprot:m.277049 g.277049  ORF g.277049 m.277049 type:complete len:73 (+) comp16145_c0_seq25:3574-3792(+)
MRTSESVVDVVVAALESAVDVDVDVVAVDAVGEVGAGIGGKHNQYSGLSCLQIEKSRPKVHSQELGSFLGAF